MSFEYNKKLADAVDTWRVIPRCILSIYGYMMYETTTWFMSLPDPNMAQAGFISTVIGGAAGIFAFYCNTGKKTT